MFNIKKYSKLILLSAVTLSLSGCCHSKSMSTQTVYIESDSSDTINHFIDIVSQNNTIEFAFNEPNTSNQSLESVKRKDPKMAAKNKHKIQQIVNGYNSLSDEDKQKMTFHVQSVTCARGSAKGNKKTAQFRAEAIRNALSAAGKICKTQINIDPRPHSEAYVGDNPGAPSKKNRVATISVQCA